MSVAATLPLAFGGLSWISLSMHRHARDAGFAMTPARLRRLGWAMLLLSLATALFAPDWHLALVEWIGLAAAAAGLVVLALHLRPTLLPRLAAGGSALGAAACLADFLLG